MPGMYVKQSAFHDFWKHEQCRKGKADTALLRALTHLYGDDGKLSEHPCRTSNT